MIMIKCPMNHLVRFEVLVKIIGLKSIGFDHWNKVLGMIKMEIFPVLGYCGSTIDALILHYCPFNQYLHRLAMEMFYLESLTPWVAFPAILSQYWLWSVSIPPLFSCEVTISFTFVAELSPRWNELTPWSFSCINLGWHYLEGRVFSSTIEQALWEDPWSRILTKRDNENDMR